MQFPCPSARPRLAATPLPLDRPPPRCRGRLPFALEKFSATRPPPFGAVDSVAEKGGGGENKEKFAGRREDDDDTFALH